MKKLRIYKITVEIIFLLLLVPRLSLGSSQIEVVGEPIHIARSSASTANKVRGYTKKNGKHVSSYHRTKANRTQKDNFSASGNLNPYTGQVGTK